MNRKEPLGLGRLHQGYASQLQSDAHAERRHFPGQLAFFQQAYYGFRNIKKCERAEVPEIFLVGNGLANQSAEQPCCRGGRHR
jgi:hypothetical protein